MNIHLPVEIWHEIFHYLTDPCQELYICDEWHDDQPFPSVEASQFGKHQADLSILRNLGYEDVLFPGSANALWTWLVPQASWRVEMTPNHDGPGYSTYQSVRQTKRLETQFGASVKHVVVAIEGEGWQFWHDRVSNQMLMRPEDMEPEYLRPSIRLLQFALEDFWDVQTFAVVIEMQPYEAKYWPYYSGAVRELWLAIVGTQRGLNIDGETMHLKDIRDAFLARRCTFTVAVRGAIAANAKYWWPLVDNTEEKLDADITPLLCGSELCKNTARHGPAFECAAYRFIEDSADYCAYE